VTQKGGRIMLNTNVTTIEKPLIDTAWSTLEAANDFRDWDVVEACRRVIDASFRDATPAHSDLRTVYSFFG
jgi:hypothetical protein